MTNVLLSISNLIWIGFFIIAQVQLRRAHKNFEEALAIANRNQEGWNEALDLCARTQKTLDEALDEIKQLINHEPVFTPQ
jgi:hypothetical protein